MHPEADLEFARAYRGYLADQWLRFSLISSAIAASLVPVFAILDFLVYREWFLVFLGLRVCCAVAIVSLSALVTYRARRFVKPVTIGLFLLIQVMILYMIAVTDGAQSGYYAGLNLTVIAMGLLLPTRVYETVAFCVVTYFGYFLACVISEADLFGVDFLANLFFLVSTGIIASFSSFFLGNRRYAEFRLSHQLEIRNRDLAELDRQKSEFFANISHELRTPLTLILAPVQDILESGKALPDYLASRLATIRENALRLLKLVNDLLDVLRLEEGHESLRIESVNVNALVGGLADGMTHLAGTKGITLAASVEEPRLRASADSRALEKVIVNLMSNSIKFTEPGGEVSVTARRAGGGVEISVSDTGVGIPESEQAYVFDRFRQADGSATRRYRGTGLGLALVKELTEKMGGRVSVASAVGAGTTMTVWLRSSSAEAAEATEDDSGADDAIEALHRLADRRGGLSIEDPDGFDLLPEQAMGDERASVLVVEDEPDMRRYLVDILGEEYRVLQARNGREGLSAALDRSPELVVLDLMLPEMDGLEVCERLRASERTRAARIMLLTARTDEESKLKALENGADDFLTKPFSAVEVQTRLRNLLQSSRLERDLAARNLRLEQAMRDLEATQAQLIQSEKLNALGSLAAGLLHEINNPLNYSLTAVQLLAGDPEIQADELRQEIVGDISEGMERIKTIVSDLRAFAYPSEVQKQGVFDFNEAVDAALRFTAHELRGIELERALPAPALVEGSKGHLTQVLVNLLTNAAKAIAGVGDERSGRVAIQGEMSNGRLLVRVRDNGRGMDQATLARVFDPFFTTRDVGEGMGLGLSVCHTIVSNHRGQLRAASRLGEGSELSFDLTAAVGGPV